MESVLLVIKDVLVYMIPPSKSSKGHKASDWDLTKFIWKGRLRLYTVDSTLTIRLEDVDTGELFALCVYTPDAVEPVLDSSRYFVIRVTDQATGIFTSYRKTCFSWSWIPGTNTIF